MSLNRLPAGWSNDRLTALNELAEALAAFEVVGRVIQAAGETLNPAAREVQADLFAVVRDAWDRVKPPPPAEPPV